MLLINVFRHSKTFGFLIPQLDIQKKAFIIHEKYKTNGD